MCCKYLVSRCFKASNLIGQFGGTLLHNPTEDGITDSMPLEDGIYNYVDSIF